MQMKFVVLFCILRENYSVYFKETIFNSTKVLELLENKPVTISR